SVSQPPADETTACHDGVDNDRDGAADCDDSDCSGTAACVEMNCTNGVDDDMDGATDCADTDCSALPICVAPHCGDGVVDAGEACDDSNTAAGAGCSDFCQVEPFYACAGAPSVCRVASLVINEVDYDQAGTDSASFIEIYNGTGADVALDGLAVVLINGSTNAE